MAIKLSIIVVAWNVAPYIQQCLSSCLLDVQFEYEVIVVANKSDDGTEVAIKNFAVQNGSHLRAVYLDRNFGLGFARNMGFGMAEGDFVMFLDGDDWLNTPVMRELYCAISNGFDLCVVNHDRVFPDGKTLGNDAFPRFSQVVQMQEEERHLLFLNLGTAWNKIVSRKLVISLELTFPDGFYEDIEWNFRILMAASSVWVMPFVVVHYRQRPGSILQSINANHFDVFRRYESLLKYLAADSYLAQKYGALIYQYCGRNLSRVLQSGRIPRGMRIQFMERAAVTLKSLRQVDGVAIAACNTESGYWRELLFRHMGFKVWRAVTWARKLL